VVCTRLPRGRPLVSRDTNPFRFTLLGAGVSKGRNGVPEVVRGTTTTRENRRDSARNSKRKKGETISEMVPVIGRWAEVCFSVGSRTAESDLRELLEEAAEAAKDEHGKASAIAWAGGYTFPPEYMASDVRCLRAAQLDFQIMVRRRLTQLSPGRLNVERVSRLRSDNPELGLMRDLAEGMRRVSQPMAVGASTDIRDSIDRGEQDARRNRGAEASVSTPLGNGATALYKHVPNLHLCKAHWTTKKGKPCGRPLGDLSDVDGMPINTDATAAEATKYYGQIRHPTIDDIAVMVYDLWIAAKKLDPSLRWEDMRIWKLDLKGAYTLLSFRPEDVGMFTMLLSNDKVYFQLAGIFGRSDTPAAFQVVTRAIIWELRHALRSNVRRRYNRRVHVG
jgi:hypothetical protein